MPTAGWNHRHIAFTGALLTGSTAAGLFGAAIRTRRTAPPAVDADEPTPEQPSTT